MEIKNTAQKVWSWDAVFRGIHNKLVLFPGIMTLQQRSLNWPCLVYMTMQYDPQLPPCAASWDELLTYLFAESDSD